MSGIQGAGTNFHTEEVKPDEPFQNENTIVVIYVIFLKSGEEFSAQLNKTGHMKLRLFSENVVTLLSAGGQLLCYTLARWSLKWCWCFHGIWLYLYTNYVHCSPYIKYLSNYDLSSDIKCNLMKLRWSANKDALLISVSLMEEGYKTWKRGKIRFCIFR